MIAAVGQKNLTPASRRIFKHRLLRFVLRRLGWGVMTIFLVSVIVFTATQLLPGDVATAILGRSATPVRLATLRAQLHLGRPVLLQYWIWASNLAQGDLGRSLINDQPVASYIGGRLGNSVILVGITAFVSLPLAMAAGVLAAVKRDKPFDIIVSVLTLGLAALPEFVVCIGLIIIFSISVVHWFPPVSLIPPGQSVLATPNVLVLPVLALTLIVFPYVFRMMRGAMIDVLESEYIEMAHLKGLSRRRLLFVHAMPAALPPTVQAIALTLAYLAGGIVVVEYVFGFAGIGQGLVNAVIARDVPVIQDMTLMLAGFYVVMNIIADMITLILTPKLAAHEA